MSNIDSDESIVSYGIGRQIGDQLTENPIPGMQLEALLEGLRDRLEGKQSAVAPAAFESAYRKLLDQKNSQLTEEGEKHLADGEAFLSKNAERDDVHVTESGLQYMVLNEGAGEKPSLNSTVTTHYHGTLTDGTIFDSSVDRGSPAQFPVNGVIPGWTEALQLMPLNSKYRLFIPHELAYGRQGAGASVPPCATLIFDVELLEIS